MLGDNFLLVTQNIDNLHERAGSQRIIHMHGELLKIRCAMSGQVQSCTGDLSADERCHCCQFPSPLRPHIVWFGEMPFGMDEIYQALNDADIFIAIGTSGHVYPAAGLSMRHGCAGHIQWNSIWNRVRCRVSLRSVTTVLPAGGAGVCPSAAGAD